MDGSEDYLYTRNNIGSVTALVTPQGTIVGQYQYSPYGQMTTSGGTTSQAPLPAFGYAGMATDQSTGLNLTLYRAYDPKLRRWLSRDPMGFAAGINVYGYVDGNPLTYSDSFGLEMWADAGGSLLIDSGAAALMVVCPECEGGALIIEVGGQLLEAGKDYYEGGQYIDEYRKELWGRDRLVPLTDRINMPSKRYRLIGFLLNYLTMVLVVAGCVGDFVRWQSYQQAQDWLIAALITLFMAAISFRIARVPGQSDASGTKPVRELEPRWPYYFIALCVIVIALDSFTSLLNSMELQIGIIAVFVVGLAKIFADSRIWRRQTGRALNARQRFVLWIIVASVLLGIYRFVELYFFA